MKIITPVFLIILYFGIYGFIHSLLASDLLKRKLSVIMGRFYAFYRIIYNITALWFLYILLINSPKPDIILYDLDFPYDLIVFGFRILFLGGLIWAISFMNVKYFLGFEQISAFFNNKEPAPTDYELIVRGPFRFSRHPVYFFSILFLLFTSYMSLFYFICFICITAYFYIGSFYEEKKLINEFGAAYIDYMKTVPRLFSLKTFRLFFI